RRDRHLRLPLRRPLVALPARHPAGRRHQRQPDGYRHLQEGAGRPVRRLPEPRGRDRPRQEGGRQVIADAAKSAALVFLAAILQASVFSSVEILNGTPDLLLVAIICVALLRGPVVGAAAGFWGGILLDTANLATLGVTSLLLTISGYWTGRYGETTGRDRAHAPFVSVAVIT